MNYFTKRLYTYSGDSEFIFNRSLKAGVSKYHVSVRNGGGKAFLFTMEVKDNAWKIADAPRLPEWIRQSEKVLSEEIARHHA